eukprot:7564605-Lingulodinium_polyedra.AAC.1
MAASSCALGVPRGSHFVNATHNANSAWMWSVSGVAITGAEATSGVSPSSRPFASSRAVWPL